MKFLIFFLIWGAALVGWILNIVKMVGFDGDVLEVEFIARVVGIFVAPLGSILGYI